MSDLAYILSAMGEGDKPLVWLHGEIKTPPMSVYARLEAGHLLRRLQRGEHPLDAGVAPHALDRSPLPRTDREDSEDGATGLPAPPC